jgi:two-component system cell cycle response regulator
LLEHNDRTARGSGASKGRHTVEFFSFRNLSLRARFLAAMGIVFIPLVLVALSSGVFMHRTVDTLNRVVGQSLYKLQTTSRLQGRIRRTYALVKDHTGPPTYTVRDRFKSEAQSVEDGFAEILGKTFLGPEEHTRLSQARRDWQECVVLADLVFTSKASQAVTYQLDQCVNQVMFALDQIYDSYYDELIAQRSQIGEAESRYLLIIVTAIGLGMVSAVIGALWLSRSVLMPLREIEKGMTHFANDNLSYRLEIDHGNEIGRLAREFNAMAERLMEHHHKLQELSARDGLTGLYNRRELEKRLQEETQRARRYSHPYSVLMLDIDHFKDVNDRYGHQTGDDVLVTVADLVRLTVRPVDLVSRYGGEELAVILPETDASGARLVAERIRRTIEESLTTTSQGDTIHVTVSIGLATFPRDSATGAGLVYAADQALYAAKVDGRNIVRSY